MFLFKKVDATILDVVISCGCGAFLMYVVGGVAYLIGKETERRSSLNRN